MGHGKTKRPRGMRYKSAYAVKIVVESVALSSVLPSFAVSLLRFLQVVAGEAVARQGGIRAAWGVLFCLVLTVVLGRLATQVYPQLLSGALPRMYREPTSFLYRPALQAYAGLAMLAMYSLLFFLFLTLLWPSGPYVTDRQVLLLALVTMVPILPYYLMFFSVDRVVKRAMEEGTLEELIATERPLYREARASVSCWRLGWLGWVAEVGIYAGLSWALWRALAGGSVEWGQWWIAMGAALVVALLRVFERLSPRWASAGSAEAWAWRVRVVRLGVVLAACAA